MGDITCIKMMDGVWHLMDPAGNGATLVTGKESALLYDTMIGMVASGLGMAVIANSPLLLNNKVVPLYFKNPPVKNLYMVYN